MSPPPRLAVTAAARRGAAPRSGSCMGPRASASTACPRPRSPVSPAGRGGPRPGVGDGTARGGPEFGATSGSRAVPAELVAVLLCPRGGRAVRAALQRRSAGTGCAQRAIRAERGAFIVSSALSAAERVSGFGFRKQNSRTEMGLGAGKYHKGMGEEDRLTYSFG